MLYPDVLRRVVVRMNLVAALSTTEPLPFRAVPAFGVTALRTTLGRIRRVYLFGRDTELCGFVLDVLVEPPERPCVERFRARPKGPGIPSLFKDG